MLLQWTDPWEVFDQAKETSVIICRFVYLYYCSHVYKSLTKIPSDVLVYKFQFSATKFYFSISQAITALLIKNKMQIEK